MGIRSQNLFLFRDKNAITLYKIRKPLVTGRKVILFVSIFGSQFLSHQKISVTTKDTAESNVKHIKHNVIRLAPTVSDLPGGDQVPSAGHHVGGWVIFSPKNTVSTWY